MATPTAQLERSATQARVLNVVRSLLIELGSQGALPLLSPDSHLDRELGLGSLERVELMARLESEFGVRLADRVASEANTPEDLADVILRESDTVLLNESESPLRAAAPAQDSLRDTLDRGVFAAETFNEVLRYQIGRAHV